MESAKSSLCICYTKYIKPVDLLQWMQKCLFVSGGVSTFLVQWRIFVHLRTELFDTACEHDGSILNQDPLDQFINIMMSHQKLLSLYKKAMRIIQRLLNV